MMTKKSETFRAAQREFAAAADRWRKIAIDAPRGSEIARSARRRTFRMENAAMEMERLAFKAEQFRFFNRIKNWWRSR